MTLDLENLRLIWWGLLGAFMLGLVLCEGLNLGVSIVLLMLAKTDQDRQSLIGFIAPTSLGSLAWLAALLAILFAAWPIAYAVLLASFYPLLLLVLLALMMRPLLVYFVNDLKNSPWRKYAYQVLAAGGLAPAALLGLLVGNLLKGIPFHLESDMRVIFLGDFTGLFNVFALLVAATGVTLLAMYAAVFLQLKTLDALKHQAQTMTIKAGVAFLILFVASGLWITHLEGYHITSDILTNHPSNPLAKFVKRNEGLWLDNFEHLPTLWSVPVTACLSAIIAMVFSKRGNTYWAMLASAVCVSMVLLTFGFSMFPFLVPSNISLNSSLTLWDSSASRLSLQVLLCVAVFALPLMGIYSRWVFGFFNPIINAEE